MPVKIEPKVFFANERTFLAWLNMAVTLGTISLAIVAFSDSSTTRASQIYGIILLPVAICFVIYAVRVYMKRAIMIRRKEPGPCRFLTNLIRIQMCMLIYETYNVNFR